MPTNAASLQKIRVARPCPARWQDMAGDDRVRFCSQCARDVYNLSALTSDEALALVRSHSGQICGRLYRRPDGTVLTADCPVGTRLFLSRVRRRVLSTLAGIALAFGGRFLTPPARESLLQHRQPSGSERKAGAHRLTPEEIQQLELLGSLGYID